MMLSVILLSLILLSLMILLFTLELASELESDQLDTVGWARKWLVDFSAGKTQPVSSDQSNNNGATDVKMD